MSKANANALTYKELATKLKDLRSGQDELDKQIDKIIALLPKDPADFEKPATEWRTIEPALRDAVAKINEGIGHLIHPVKCVG